MKNIHTKLIKLHFVFFLLLLQTTVGQTDNITRNATLDSIKKFVFIYPIVREHKTSTTYQDFSGNNKGSTKTRGISIDFKIGVDGPIQNIGKRGKNLKEVIEDDPEALSEFNSAFKVHLRKKKIWNSLEYLGYVVAFGSAVVLFVGLDSYETDGVTGTAAAGGIGVAAGFTSVVVFYKLTEKEMDAYRDSILKSIEIYNRNKLKLL